MRCWRAPHQPRSRASPSAACVPPCSKAPPPPDLRRRSVTKPSHRHASPGQSRATRCVVSGASGAHRTAAGDSLRRIRCISHPPCRHLARTASQQATGCSASGGFGTQRVRGGDWMLRIWSFPHPACAWGRPDTPHAEHPAPSVTQSRTGRLVAGDSMRRMRNAGRRGGACVSPSPCRRRECRASCRRRRPHHRSASSHRRVLVRPGERRARPRRRTLRRSRPCRDRRRRY